MDKPSELEQLIQEIDAHFSAMVNVRNPRYELFSEEWQLLRYNLPRQLLTPGLPPAETPIDRSGVIRTASLRSLKTMVDSSAMNEQEWRAVLINLIERIEKLEAPITSLGIGS